jgi:hypothetical protein
MAGCAAVIDVVYAEDNMVLVKGFFQRSVKFVTTMEPSSGGSIKVFPGGLGTVIEVTPVVSSKSVRLLLFATAWCTRRWRISRAEVSSSTLPRTKRQRLRDGWQVRDDGI